MFKIGFMQFKNEFTQYEFGLELVNLDVEMVYIYYEESVDRTILRIAAIVKKTIKIFILQNFDVTLHTILYINK